MRLAGELNVAALEESLRQIVQRHEVLRTRYEVRGQQAVQVIEEEGEVELRVWDVSELEEGRREEMAREVVREESGRGFDLEKGPVIRAGLVRLSGGRARADGGDAPHSE